MGLSDRDYYRDRHKQLSRSRRRIDLERFKGLPTWLLGVVFGISIVGLAALAGHLAK